MASRRIFFDGLSVTIIDTLNEDVLVSNQLYIDARGIEPDLDLWSIFDKVKAELCLLVNNVDQACEILFSDYQRIDAAGGIVRADGCTLWIKRNGKWDLPKGKVEAGEAFNEAALREVSEECGVTSLTIVELAGLTYHCYEMNDKRVLKTSHWFVMTGAKEDNLVPQSEEGITEVQWVDDSKMDAQLGNTFGSIESLITAQSGTSAS